MCQKECQKICQKVCQKEYQKICQKESEAHVNKMSEMSEALSERMPDKMQKICQMAHCQVVY